jgi:GTP diphosphokinase / guanosine-3',5'-bis(diphosphate) 3'-diphosphatase
MATVGPVTPETAADSTPVEKAKRARPKGGRPGPPAPLTVEQKFELLLKTVSANRPADDLDIIRKAWDFCVQQHEGQKRASGEPYVIHPLEVALVLAEMKMDSTAIAAGLLHDAVEDTPVTTDEIYEKFGEQVAHIVEGVTKLDKIEFANREDQQAENIRKMLLAMVSDIRVVIIKLADRLHNMRTLEHLKPARQAAIAQETLDIYAPLAHRLGMGKLRGELEDYAFRYTDPVSYEHVSTELERLRGEGEKFLRHVVKQLDDRLKLHGITARVEWRIKRLYSIQQKLQKQTIPLEQVYDLLAVRVITQTVQDCYAVFGLIHSMWQPVPGRIKDFIAMPRPNMYQSLHTTVIADGAHQFEVQIRTEEMHRVAEEGIAAHWKYKAGDSPVSAKDEQRLAWVRQLVDWQREMTDPNEFLSTLKIDLYPEEVYTFTPKGKVVVLPTDATPVDFAYAVHTEVGHTTTGAKVNGRMAPLRTKLKNGDIVEIFTQAGHSPSRDWLSFTKSTRARNKIKHWLTEHQRERAVEIGRKLLEREARKYKVSLNGFEDADFIRVAGEYGLGGPPELMAGIGFGKYSARQVLNKLQPGSTMAAEPETEVAQPNSIDSMSDAVKRVYFGKGAESLQVEGQDDLLVYRARCCNPIRGEEIVGYVTRGKGVAVHARSCSNVQNLMYEADRRIQVEWSAPKGSEGATTYPVRLTVICDDRPGLLKEMTAIISADDTNIRNLDSRESGDGGAIVDFVVLTQSLTHLNKLVMDLRRIPGVREVQRSQKI